MKSPKVFATRVWPESAWSLADNEVWSVPADVHEVRFDIETNRGGWQTLRSIKGLAILHTGKDTSHYGEYVNEMQIIGIRSLNNPRESGHEQEGHVNANGKRYRAFTSSVLFMRPDGSLCDVAILYCCERDKEDLTTVVPCLPPFDKDGVNLDAMSADELEDFIHKGGSSLFKPILAQRALFPKKQRGSLHSTRMLRAYAYNKLTAIGLRLAGKDDSQYTKICDRIYAELPAFAKFW